MPVRVEEGLSLTRRFERCEEKVLGFNPMSRQGELVDKELSKNDIGQLLAVLGAGPFIFFPFLEDLVEAR